MKCNDALTFQRWYIYIYIYKYINTEQIVHPTVELTVNNK